MLRMLRRQALLTQEELAQRAGLSTGTIRGLEQGRVRRPHSESIRLLARALELSDEKRRSLVAVALGESPADSDVEPPPVRAVAPASCRPHRGCSLAEQMSCPRSIVCMTVRR